MNHLPDADEGSDSNLPQTAKYRIKVANQKNLYIIRKVLVNCCGGQELGFFFIPKRNAFQKMHDLLAEYSSNVAVYYEPKRSGVQPGVEVDEDGREEDFDFTGRLEYLMSRACSKIAGSLMLGLQGSLRVVTLRQKPLHSFPINFGSFCELMRLLDQAEAFRARDRKKPLRLSRRKQIPLKVIYFKMRAKVPLTHVSPSFLKLS